MFDPFSMVPREVPKVDTKYRHIETKIPVPESLATFDEMAKYETYSNTGMPPIVWHHTENGFQVCDPYGNKFIDFSSAILITNCGHALPEMQEAIINVVKKPMLSAYLFCTEERIAAAKALISVCPIPDAKVFMLSAGTEACDAALKMMRTYGKLHHGPQKKIVITFEGSFHGRTLGAQLLGGMPELKDWIGNLDPDIVQAPYPTWYDHDWANPNLPGYSDDNMFKTSILDTIEKYNINPENICGIFIESYHAPLCCPCPPAFAQRLRKFCDKYDILLGMDEVQIGACRSGKFWSFENYGIIPDLFTAAKGMAGAMPQSALFGRRDIMDIYAPGDLTSTHSGSPIASVATVANIEYLKKNKVWEMAAEKGKVMEDFLNKLQAEFPNRIGYVGGIGMGRCVTFADSKKTPKNDFARAVLVRAIEKGLMFSTPVWHGATQRLCPPLTIPMDALMEGMETYREAIAEIDKEMPAYE